MNNEPAQEQWQLVTLQITPEFSRKVIALKLGPAGHVLLGIEFLRWQDRRPDTDEDWPLSKMNALLDEVVESIVAAHNAQHSAPHVMQPEEREQWHVYEARFGPSGYSWCDVMCNNRVVARCSNRADADAIVAAHNAQPSAPWHVIYDVPPAHDFDSSKFVAVSNGQWSALVYMAPESAQAMCDEWNRAQSSAVEAKGALADGLRSELRRAIKRYDYNPDGPEKRGRSPTGEEQRFMRAYDALPTTPEQQ